MLFIAQRERVRASNYSRLLAVDGGSSRKNATGGSEQRTMSMTMKGPAAAAKARTRVAVQYREELPSGLQRAIDADGGVLLVDRVLNTRDQQARRAMLPPLGGAKKITTQQAVAMDEVPVVSRDSIAAAARDSANGMVADKSAPSTETVLGMQKKKQQRLLEKAESRPSAEVMKSAPVGTASFTLAPKLSDFKEGTYEERVRQHAEAMTKFGQNNLTSKAIENETRVRARDAGFHTHNMRWNLARHILGGDEVHMRTLLKRTGWTCACHADVWRSGLCRAVRVRCARSGSTGRARRSSARG